jgi:hypothetical protein
MTALLLAHGDGDVFGPFSAWTFLLRGGQALLQTAPTLLVGVVLAAFLETPTGRRWVHAFFSGPTWQRLMRAALLGLATPVGAIGALPIASGLSRLGVSPAAVLAFVVTAPLFMPWSFGQAADTMGWTPIVIVVAASLLLAAAVGAVAVRLQRGTSQPHPAPPANTRSQLFIAAQIAARHCAGWLAVCVAAACGASALLAAVLEPGAIEAHLSETTTLTLLELAVPLTLASVTPEVGAVFASEFWRIGLLPGGVLLAFFAGAGVTAGTLIWAVHRLGRLGAAAMLVHITLSLGLAVACNALLTVPRPGEADSHAFDRLTKPYRIPSDAVSTALLRQWSREGAGATLALFTLTGLAVAGLILRHRRQRRPSAPHSGGNEGTALPTPRVARLTLALAIAACALASTYGYFPPPHEIDERLQLQSGNLFEAARRLEQADRDQSERLAARRQALNALDRIETLVTRRPVATTLYLAQHDVPTPDPRMIQARVSQLRAHLETTPTDGISRATLALTAQLTTAAPRVSD